MGTLQKPLTELATLLRSRGFVDVLHVNMNGTEKIIPDYGPLGTILRHNIRKRWWEKMVYQQTNVFPVDGSFALTNPASFISSCSGFDDNGSQEEKTAFEDCAKKYLQALKLTNKRLPVSIASSGTYANIEKVLNATESEIRHLLLGGAVRTKLSLQSFISPTGSRSVLDYWLQLRLSWWKQFSNHPARFSVQTSYENGLSDKKQNGDKTNGLAENTLNIVYDFPWGQESVEEVKNLGDGPFRDTIDKETYMAKSTGSKSVIPLCIECDTSIESAMAAWLVDSFYERSQGKKKTSKSKISTKVLQLHPQLAPYQVAIVTPPSSLTKSPASSTVPSSLETRHICNYLEQGFQSASVSVLNTCTHGGSVEAHYKRNDELGIPYTVVVNQSSVTDGLLSVRHRDTQVKTSYHISNLVENLSKNLKRPLE